MIESDLFNEEIISKLESQFPQAKQLKRSPLTDNGAVDGIDFFMRFATSYYRQVTEVRNGERDTADFEIPIILDIGFPNSGKSRYGDLLRQMFGAIPNIDLSLNLPQKYHPLKILEWEKHGEDRARKFGEIETLPDKSFLPLELQASNNHFARSIQESLEDPTTQAILIEAPGNTAINIDGTLVGRDLATGVFIDLAQGKGIFENFNQPGHPHYVVWGAGLRAGPLVRFLLSYARDRFRKAALENNMTKAIVTANNFNIPIPQNIQEVVRLGQGASLSQMELIDNLANTMISAAIARGHSLNIADYDEYSRLVDPRIYNFVPGLVVNSTTQRGMVSLVANFLLNRNHLGLPEARTFLGDNDPTADELGLTDEHFARIYASHEAF